MIKRVVLGLGSNVGRKIKNIKSSLKLLTSSNKFNLLALSHIYESQPWGYTKQKNFLNCIAIGITKLSVLEFFFEIKKIEKILGRIKRKKWGKREIDIDILFWGNEIIRNKTLTVPHPEIKNRKFVLKPLLELIPYYKHPVLKKNIKYLFKHTKDRRKVWIYDKPM